MEEEGCDDFYNEEAYDRYVVVKGLLDEVSAIWEEEEDTEDLR